MAGDADNSDALGDSPLGPLSAAGTGWAPWRSGDRRPTPVSPPPAGRGRGGPALPQSAFPGTPDGRGPPPHWHRAPQRYYLEQTQQRVLRRRDFVKVCWECGLSEHERSTCPNVINRMTLRLRRVEQYEPGSSAFGAAIALTWRPENAYISEQDLADCFCMICDKPGAVNCCSPTGTAAPVPSCCRCGDIGHRADNCGLVNYGNDWHGSRGRGGPPPPGLPVGADPARTPTPPPPPPPARRGAIGRPRGDIGLPPAIPPPPGGSRGSRLERRVKEGMPRPPPEPGMAAGRGSARGGKGGKQWGGPPPQPPPPPPPPPPSGRGRGAAGRAGAERYAPYPSKGSGGWRGR